MKPFIIIIAILIFYISCSNRSNEIIDVQQNKNDSIKNVYRKIYATKFSWIGSKMNFPPITRGFDSFEIRIWSSSMLSPNSAVRISKSPLGLIMQAFEFSITEDSLVSYKEVKSRNDSIGYLFNEIEKVDFSTFISQENIPGFEDLVADGITYIMEIASTNNYKILVYHCPGYYGKSEPNNKKFLDLLILIDRTLPFYRPFCEFME